MGTTASQVFSWSDKAQAQGQALPPLLVKAEKVAATVILGVHGRKRAGPGESFWQYRPYSFGDSTQRIDWRRSAVSDRVFIRESEWEAANTLWLWSDAGARMNFKSHLSNDTKRDRALLLTLAMASLAVRAHERIGGLGSDSAPGYGRSALTRVAEYLLQPKAQTLPVLRTLQKRSAAVIASDFLDEPEKIKAALVPFAQAGIRGHLVQVCDPAEETLPYEGRVEFHGLDTPARYLASKADALREAYAEKYKAQRDTVRAFAKSIGWTFTVHRTDQSVIACLMALYAQVQDAPQLSANGAAA